LVRWTLSPSSRTSNRARSTWRAPSSKISSSDVSKDATRRRCAWILASDVVVGADLEAQELVSLLDPRREHDDRDAARLVGPPQLAAEREPVDVGKVQVQDHEVERLLLERRQRGDAGDVMLDLVALLFAQVEPDRVGDVGVVLDQRDPLDRHAVPGRWHRRRTPARRRLSHARSPSRIAR
jgi:hypothetical protein